MGETITKHRFGKGLGSTIYVEILGLINKTNQFLRIKRLNILSRKFLNITRKHIKRILNVVNHQGNKNYNLKGNPHPKENYRLTFLIISVRVLYSKGTSRKWTVIMQGH